MSGFVTRNKPDWDELERLVTSARKSMRRMTPEQLSRLDVLYRRTTIHLSQVSTRTRDRRLIRYLNDLTANAHGLIYLPPKRSLFAGIGHFVFEGFARSLARNWKMHAISAALLVGGAVFAYFAAMADPLTAYALWPRQDQRQPGSSHEQLLEVLRGGRDQKGGSKFFFASFLFSHNLKVGLLALSTGVLAAIPTTLLMIYNGMLLGVFVAIHQRAGIDAELWAWILPHGITEMGSVTTRGATGWRYFARSGRDAVPRRDHRKFLASKSPVDVRAFDLRSRVCAVLGPAGRPWLSARESGQSTQRRFRWRRSIN
jgi:uncharacterized membrane protein SpoIIM required for sporulation